MALIIIRKKERNFITRAKGIAKIRVGTGHYHGAKGLARSGRGNCGLLIVRAKLGFICLSFEPLQIGNIPA
jgi:hypothetical protein